MSMHKISRRGFLRGTGAAAAIVGGATPLWLQWLNDQMGKLQGKHYSIPAEEWRSFKVNEIGDLSFVGYNVAFNPDDRKISGFNMDDEINKILKNVGDKPIALTMDMSVEYELPADKAVEMNQKNGIWRVAGEGGEERGWVMVRDEEG